MFSSAVSVRLVKPLIDPAAAHLLRTQFAPLVHQVPALYVIGTINSIMLAHTFVGVAPSWLTMDCPILMSIVTFARAMMWLRQRRRPIVAPAKIARQLRTTNVLTILLSLIFVTWALTLMQYGDTLLQMHAAFYTVVTGIGCAFCLVTLPSAAISMISITMLSSAVALLLTGRPLFVNEVLDILLIYGILVFVFLTCHRHLKGLSASRQEVIERSEEIAALHKFAQETERRRLAERQASVDEIVETFSGSIENVSHALANLSERNRTQSRDLAADSEAALRRVEGVDQAARKARTNLGLVLDGAGALFEAIESIRRQIARTADVFQHVERKTERALAAMDSLCARIRDVDELTGLITQVTQQINFIALNATIEAARAGEAGRGFAAVAMEIKTLAATTSRATRTIAEQICGIKDASREAMGGVEDLNRAFSELQVSAREVAGVATTQSSLTDTIRGCVDAALKGADEVDGGLGGMRRAAADNHASALSMLDSCEILRTEATKLSGSVRYFMSFVQAPAA